jgi:hypothetical protein
LELAACICYEYARESPTIRGLAEKYFALKREHDHKVEVEFRSRLSESLGPRNKRNEFPPDWKKKLDERKAGFLDNLMVGSPEFQRLGAETSDNDCARNLLHDWRFALLVFAGLESGRIVLGLADFPDKPWTTTDELLRKAAISQAAMVTPKLVTHYPWRAGSWPSTGREFDSGGETLILRIGWGEGTTEQIVREFRKWATQYRRNHCRHMPPPRGRQLKVTKAWLRRLAEMPKTNLGARVGTAGSRMRYLMFALTCSASSSCRCNYHVSRSATTIAALAGSRGY